jgi:hypothetical protein
MTHQESSFLRRSQRALTTIVLTMAGALAANATTIFSTTFNDWKAPTSISGSPTGYFTGSSVKQFSYNTAAGLTLTGAFGNATVTGVSGSSYVLSGDPYSQTLSGAAAAGSYINIAFQTAQNAVAVFFNNSNRMTYTVTLSDGQTFSTTGSMIGLSLSNTITGLSIATTPGTQAVINDLLMGKSALPADAPTAPTATPEPASILLLSGGLLVLFSCQRRLFGSAKA